MPRTRKSAATVAQILVVTPTQQRAPAAVAEAAVAKIKRADREEVQP
jgi:hypothetical protein